MINRLFIRDVQVRNSIPKDSYLFDLPVVRGLREMEHLIFTKQVTFLVGENGAGKSTLIEAVAAQMGFNPEGGTRNFMFSTENTHSELYKHIVIGKGASSPRDGFFFRAESFYNTATYVDSLFGGDSIPDYYGGKSLHRQSHGESFLSLMTNRFSADGLYIMDEPEAALSPMRQMELMCLIKRLADDGAQFIISTHSPMLITLPEAEVLELTDFGIKSVDYRDTEHFQMVKRFLDNPERMLKYMFE